MKAPSASDSPEKYDHTARVHPYSNPTFIKSVEHALHGVLHVFRHERNARIHLWLALGAFVLGILLGVSDAELAAVFFAVIIVFLAEIFNTAIERTLDLIDPNENPRVKLIKDMAAGGVLLAALAALAIAAVVFGPVLLRFVWGR